MDLHKTKSGKIKIKNRTKQDRMILLLLSILILITIITFIKMDYGRFGLIEGTTRLLDNLLTMFLRPSLDKYFLLSDILYKIFTTLLLAILATIFGAIIGISLGLLSSNKVSNNYIIYTIRVFVSFVRAVPTIVWMILFVVSYGLGATSAVVGMTLHSAAYLIKASSETFDELDDGIVEALKASGANKIQIIFQGILPASLPSLVSWIFVRFEINFAVSVAVGAVTAGNLSIGWELFQTSTNLLVRPLGYIIILVLLTALLIEMLGIYIRRKLK